MSARDTDPRQTARAEPPAPVRVARAAWIGLIVLGLAWELWIAPLAGGRWLLGLKVVPLFFLLAAVWRGSAYGMQVALLIVLGYVLEGGLRLFDPAPVRWLAIIELALAAVFFVATIVYLRPLKRAARARARSTG